jgi:hypothetical protein
MLKVLILDVIKEMENVLYKEKESVYYFKSYSY